MQREELKALQKTIREIHRCSSRHFTTVPVTATVRGQVAWQGDVEIFDLIRHPTAQTCYAWSYNDDGTSRRFAVLGLPPVDSAEAAVNVAIAAKARQ